MAVFCMIALVFVFMLYRSRSIRLRDKLNSDVDPGKGGANNGGAWRTGPDQITNRRGAIAAQKARKLKRNGS